MPASANAVPNEVQRLTRGLAAGNEASFRDFHAQYFDRLHHFHVMLARGDDHAAQDALQETLLRVVRYAREFEVEEIFWSWLKALARSTARDGGRRRKRYLARLRDFALGVSPTGPANDQHEACDTPHAILADALLAIDPTDRDLIEGKYFRGESIADLAARTGLTEKAVDSRLVRIRRQLNTTLRQKLRAR
jgi:RNA polymerase sigma-70 factor (ECF subfamily)